MFELQPELCELLARAARAISPSCESYKPEELHMELYLARAECACYNLSLAARAIA